MLAPQHCRMTGPTIKARAESPRPCLDGSHAGAFDKPLTAIGCRNSLCGQTRSVSAERATWARLAEDTV